MLERSAAARLHDLCWLLLLPCLNAMAWPQAGLVLAPAAGGGALILESAGACRSAATGAERHRGGMVVLGDAAAKNHPRFDGEIGQLIREVAADHGFDPSLIAAIIHVESAFNARAVSHKGALGLMQIMPATAIGLGVVNPARDLLDPHANLHAGARHLRGLSARYPDRLDLALAAYNAGEGAVARWSGIPPYAETRRYVASVLSWYDTYRMAMPREPMLVNRCL